MELDLHADGSGTIQAFRELPTGHGIVYRASNIKRERTGIHARLGLLLQEDAGKGLTETELAWTYCNVEKDEERVRLCNNAWRVMTRALQNAFSPPDTKGDPKLTYKHELDDFCSRLWECFIRASLPVETAGERGQVKFTLYPYLIEGGGTILFGPPGKGKSFLGMTEAVCIDAGLQTFWPVKHTKVLIINLERSEASVRYRLARINEALGLPFNRSILMLNQRGQSLVDIKDVVEASIYKHKVGLILLDSISRAGAGDLTENRPVNAIIDILNGFGVSWLALAHSPRASDEHIFGGIHFDAGADVVVRLTSEENELGLGVGLQITKANDVGKVPLQTLGFGFDTTGLTKIWKAKQEDFPNLEASQILSPIQKILQALSNADKSTAGEIAEAVGGDRANISRILNTNSKLFTRFKDGREVLFGLKTRREPGE